MDAIVYDKVGKEAEKVREALYGIYPQATITDAAIASFDDGADGIPVKALTVGIEPVQDLHGYENPWPGGGGKNKLDYDTAYAAFKIGENSFSGNSNDIANNAVNVPAELIGQQLTFSAYIDLTGLTAPSTYTVIAVVSGATISGTYVAAGSAGYVSVTFTPTSNEDIVKFTWGAGNSTIKVKDFQLEIGSARTEWAPYSNICPISGWTGAEISDAAVNIWDEEWELGRFDTTTGANVSNTTQIRSKNFIPLKGGMQYYLKTPRAVWIIFFDKDKTPVPPPDYSWSSINGKSMQIVDRVFQAPDSACYCRFYCINEYGVTYNNNISINYPATDTEYHPYTGNQISVTFPTSADTVYGARMTLNPDRTGTMVVDHASINLGTLDYRYEVNNKQFFSNSIQNAAFSSTPGTVLVCSCYPIFFEGWGVAPYPHIRDIINARLYVADENYANDPESLKSALAGQTLVYKLAEPTTYQLTASEVSGILTTIYGTNNVWASTGNIEKLTYRADLGKYIDSHITTAVANALNA